MSITAARTMKVCAELMQKAGPYLLLEILLPGGTLFALLLFVYRRREAFGIPDLQPVVAAALRVFGRLREYVASVLEPYRLAVWMSRGRHRDHDGLEALAFAPTAV